MARRYAHDELIQLRSSPLVPAKPPGLPPVEEWMGPLPDQTQYANQVRATRTVSRGKNEGSLANDAPSGRRLAFEARGKSTTAPSDIVLGPPKSSFPSASGRSTQRSGVASHDDELTQNDRSNHPERHTRDGHRHERDEKHAHESRTGPIHNRRSMKDDTDLWSGVRQNRPAGKEDNERPPRRNDDRDYGREQDGGGDQRRERGSDNHQRGANREANGENIEKRNGLLRSREVASWARDEDKKAAGDAMVGKPRAREFRDNDRRGHRGQERGWGRGAKQEEDPAWNSDGPEPEEKKQAATQADFEQWRAQMRAEKEGRRVPDVSTVDHPPVHDRATSSTGPGAAKGKVDIPLDLGVSDDKFFDILGRPKKEKHTINGQGYDLGQDLINAAAKMAKPSKFSSLFTSNTTPETAVAAVRNIAPEETSNEDKAGFQRILNLLGQQQQPDMGERTPQPSTIQNTHSAPPVQSPRALERNSQQDYFDCQSPPANATPKTTDGEFLLKLMRHPQQGRTEPHQANNSTQNQENTPGMLSLSTLMISPKTEPPHLTRSSGPAPGFFDEPPRESIPPRDKLNPHAQNQRGPPSGIYDLFNNPSRPSPAGLPPGLERRPPEIDHLPPGFSQLPQQQRQNMVPPPGFPPPQRIQGGIAPGMFGSRFNGPAMPPPPGFMHVGGPPPPGFSPLGYGHDGPPLGNGGFDYGQGFPPPGQQRR
ncbi:MAG: hypothetical protein Q9217_003398 [Psora testacea]